MMYQKKETSLCKGVKSNSGKPVGCRHFHIATCVEAPFSLSIQNREIHPGN